MVSYSFMVVILNFLHNVNAHAPLTMGEACSRKGSRRSSRAEQRAGQGLSCRGLFGLGWGEESGRLDRPAVPACGSPGAAGWLRCASRVGPSCRPWSPRLGGPKHPKLCWWWCPRRTYWMAWSQCGSQAGFVGVRCPRDPSVYLIPRTSMRTRP